MRLAEGVDGLHLAGGFDDGRGAALKVQPGVRGAARDAQGVAADAFAAGLAGALRAGGGLQHQHGIGLLREFFRQRLRGGTADLFVGHKKQPDRAGAVALGRAERAGRRAPVRCRPSCQRLRGRTACRPSRARAWCAGFRAGRRCPCGRAAASAVSGAGRGNPPAEPGRGLSAGASAPVRQCRQSLWQSPRASVAMGSAAPEGDSKST